jgi:predicted PurR-regulated permease PerM
MDRVLKIVAGALTVGILIFLAWRFSDIVAYILVAAVLSIIGKPLVKLLDKVKLGKFHLPHTLNALVTLILLIGLIGGLLSIFVPLIVNQAALISEIDVDGVSKDLKGTFQDLEFQLRSYGVIPEGQTFESILSESLEGVVSVATFSTFFQDIIGMTGDIFIALFSIVFITFFFLRDDELFFKGVLLLTPERYEKAGEEILDTSKKLLSRYFIGIMIEITTMMTLLSTGLTILGVENALLIGVVGGLLNVIPYLGPVIGASIGVILSLITNVSVGDYHDMLWDAIKVLGTFSACNLVDNMVLQPWIYSNSVKAHPLEIFLVIMIAGSLAGVTGMILAIPGYTVIRIIAKSFFNRYKLVKKLTENI